MATFAPAWPPGENSRSRALRRPATRSSPQARIGRPSPRRLRPPGSGRASRSALASVEDAASTEAAARRRGTADAGLRGNRLGVTPIGVEAPRSGGLVAAATQSCLHCRSASRRRLHGPCSARTTRARRITRWLSAQAAAVCGSSLALCSRDLAVHRGAADGEQLRELSDRVIATIMCCRPRSRSQGVRESDGDPAAVGGQDCAVDETRVVRSEEADSAGDLVRGGAVPGRRA
jgi:hypothetical protein